MIRLSIAIQPAQVKRGPYNVQALARELVGCIFLNAMGQANNAKCLLFSRMKIKPIINNEI